MSKKRTVKYKLDPDNIPPLTGKQRATLEELDKMPDSAIDLSDIPEHTTFYKPIKRQTTVRIDADVLA
ncbi:MAG: cytoplasmic protein, partial [Deltaproteobacteria bacterium]|nr:cytoplasmic protein [Deltaproteobacteria bacterium]